MKNKIENGFISRRKFLKICSLTAAGLAVPEIEFTLRPVGLLAGTLSHILNLPEGNPLEFYTVYSRLFSQAYLFPSQPENARNLEAFMALNGALDVLSAGSRVTPVTRLGEVTLRHFLYGSGNSLDLTAAVSTDIKAEFASTDLLIKEILTPDRFTPVGIFHKDKSFRLIGTANSPSFGFQSAFGKVGMIITGEPHRVTSGLELTHPYFSLFDRYDFSSDTPNPPTGQLADNIFSLAEKIHLSPETLKKLIPEPLKLAHSALLLQNNNIAHPYDISTGKFYCQNPILIPAAILS